MKSIFAQDSHDGSVAVTSGVADLMTSLAVIFILLLVAYVTRVEDKHADPVRDRVIPTDMTPSFAPTLETTRPSVQTITVPDAAINFEFGKSRLLPAAEIFLSEAMPHYASIACGPTEQEV
jgi:hypothetical protein